MKEKILSDFKEQESVLSAFKEKLIPLISDLLKQSKVSVHHITGRTKGYESLSKKIDMKKGKYTKIEDITDIVGIRIITYLESEVNLVANVLESEFELDKENSIDKRVLKTDQFGYKSLHYVIFLKNARTALTEYKAYKALKCEVQIRSILQHAWAEIEHDLGYKGAISHSFRFCKKFQQARGTSRIS